MSTSPVDDAKSEVVVERMAKLEIKSDDDLVVVDKRGLATPWSSDILSSYLTNRIGYLVPPAERLQMVDLVRGSVPNLRVDGSYITQTVVQYLSTRSLDHPSYSEAAALVAIDAVQASAISLGIETFADWVRAMHENSTSKITPEGDTIEVRHPLVTDEVLRIATSDEWRDVIEATIQAERKLFRIDWAGWRMLCTGYIAHLNGRQVTPPWYHFMRVALGIHGDNVPDALCAFSDYIHKRYTHATPTLANAGKNGNLASCALMQVDDNIESITCAVEEAMRISCSNSGLGIGLSNLRTAGRLISSTGGTAKGQAALAKLLASVAIYADQGGTRPGAFAVYVPAWSSDIFRILALRNPSTAEGERALHMNVGVCINDLIMGRINADMQRLRDNVPHAEPVMVSLFSPDQDPRLALVHGAEFEELYLKLENDPTVERVRVPGSVLMRNIAQSVLRTGQPYIFFTDTANARSNQMNRGTITHSNLCTEIIEYSSREETAVCNLASINLPKFVRCRAPGGPLEFDHEMLRETTKRVVVALNRVIDRMDYPTPAAKLSNERMRPTGVGIQGLATTFQLLGLVYDSPEARLLNVDIASTIYYAALSASCDLAEKDGPYPFFVDSPVSKGLLQFDLCNLEAERLGRPVRPYETRSVSKAVWDDLKERIKTHGLRNSLLVAPMPTMSTSTLLGNPCSQSFEVPKAYAKTAIGPAGSLGILDRTLVETLQAHGLWTSEMRDLLLKNFGSIKHIDGIPDEIKRIFRTAWEIALRAQIEMAADRGYFVDQGQSFNVHLPDASFERVWLVIKRAHEQALKTIYYWFVQQSEETRGTTFGLSAEIVAGAKKTAEGAVCEVGCETCSS